tara:strand:+ start:91 stop:561 length:471 start_codon:yes stop_codon:yes gene_type:complete
MTWYEELVAVFTDDGGLWTVTSNWESAREFVKGVIGNSTMSEPERIKLIEHEQIAFDLFFEKSRNSLDASSGGVFSLLTYSDDEIKTDIGKYSDHLFEYVSTNGYPEQVIKVFANLAETTYAVSNPETELGEPSFIVPKWLKYASIGLVVLLVLRR